MCVIAYLNWSIFFPSILYYTLSLNFVFQNAFPLLYILAHLISDWLTWRILNLISLREISFNLALLLIDYFAILHLFEYILSNWFMNSDVFSTFIASHNKLLISPLIFSTFFMILEWPAFLYRRVRISSFTKIFFWLLSMFSEWRLV